MKSQVKLSNLLPNLQPAVIDAICELVPEPEAAFVIRKGIARDIETLEGDERTAIQYVSTRDLDRDGEILDPKGAILDQFKLAPQVLWGHDYTSPPIGSDEWIKRDENGIIAKTRYASTDRAQEIFTLKQEGHLRTQSVGFVPIEFVDADGSGWAEVVKRLGKRWDMQPEDFANVKRIHTKWLLLEHSDVSVPSNIHALQLAVSKGLDVSGGLLKELGVEELPGEPEPIPDGKPYPNEHACRLADPAQFDRFRRGTRDHNGKKYSVIYGIKGGKAQDQAYRYKKDVWSASEARSHCKSHDGSFEAAASERRIWNEEPVLTEVPEPEEKQFLRRFWEVVDVERGRV